MTLNVQWGPEHPQILRWAPDRGVGRGGDNAQVGFVPVAGATYHTGLLDHHLPHLQEAEAAVNLWARGAGSMPVLMEKGNPRVPPQLPHFPMPQIVLGLTLHQSPNKTPSPSPHLSPRPPLEAFPDPVAQVIHGSLPSVPQDPQEPQDCTMAQGLHTYSHRQHHRQHIGSPGCQDLGKV